MSKLEKQQIIDEIHRNATKYFTNAYMDVQTLSGLLSKDTSLFEVHPGLALLVYLDGQIWRAVCFADSIASLSNLKLPFVGKNKVSVLFEVIGTEETLSEIRTALNHGNSALKRYKRLHKMTYRLCETDDIKALEKVELAEVNDAAAIEALLIKTFDRNVSHIPDQSEICDYLTKNRIMVIRDKSLNGKLKSFLMLERIGQKTGYIFQLAVAPEYRRQGLARKLLSTFLAKEELGMNYFLWVEEDNDAAIGLYEKLGFRYASQMIEIYKADQN